MDNQLDKSKLHPQSHKFLRVIINSYGTVLADKLKLIRKKLSWAITQYQSQKTISLRELARLIEELIALDLTILPTRLKTWNMLKLKNNHLYLKWKNKLLINKKAFVEIT